MSNSSDPFVWQRAELLANLVLTRRKDLRVVPFDKTMDSGIDLLVHVYSKEVPEIIPSFGVEIIGTSEPLKDEKNANTYANHRRKELATKGLLLLPVVVFLFSADGDKGYYSWLMQPGVTKDRGPTLMRVSPLDFRKISKDTVDDIVDRVTRWSHAMAEIVLEHKTKKG